MKKYDEFFKKYSQITDEDIQKEFLSKFMLSLSKEELFEFTKENINQIKRIEKERPLNADEREKFFRAFDEKMIPLKHELKKEAV